MRRHGPVIAQYTDSEDESLEVASFTLSSDDSGHIVGIHAPVLLHSVIWFGPEG